MNNKKIIAVTGATGAQGGGLAKAVLTDPNTEFAVRALTRNSESDMSQALAALGAEVVTADLDNVESLRKAFDGAYGVYGVTNFWEHFSPEREMTQAKNLAQAAKDADIKHFVWSTLDDTRNFVPIESDQMPTLMGKYKVPHYDAKGEADQFLKDLSVPTTFLLTSFYWDNFVRFGMGPQPGPDSKLNIAFPMDDAKLPGIAAEDIGKAAYGVFKEGAANIGKYVGIAGEHLSGAEMAEKMSRALGQPIGFYRITPDAYRALGFPGAEDLGNMFQFKRDFEEAYRAARPLERSRQLNPELLTFDEWLVKYGTRIPLPVQA